MIRAPRLAYVRMQRAIGEYLRRVFAVAIVLIPCHAFGQTAFENYESSLSQWRFGTLVLSTGDTVSLEFTFANRSKDGLMEVKDAGRVITLSVQDIASFYFYDIESDRGRNFRTLEASFDGKDLRKIFLEYHYGDENIAVVSQHEVGVRYVDRPYKVKPRPEAVYSATTYLLNVKTQLLIPFNRRNAFDLMSNHEKLVSNFIKTNRIKLRSPDDYQSVFRYYSSLLSSQ